jgi:NitT/TauT family transport system permease protein
MTSIAQEQLGTLPRKPSHAPETSNADLLAYLAPAQHDLSAFPEKTSRLDRRQTSVEIRSSVSSFQDFVMAVGKRSRSVAQSAPIIILFLLAWEFVPRIATRLDLFDSTFLPPFSTVFRAFCEIAVDGTLLKHLSVSLGRAGAGFLLANVVAIPLGLLIGWFPAVERFLDPVLQTFRQTAAMALFPVFILLFGIGEPSKVVLIYWGAQWPILLSTITGVKSVDPLLTKAARSMNASTLQIFFKVILPAAFPAIFTGVRLAATHSILILIAAEMIGADRGLGYLVYDSQVRFEIPLMYAGIISLSLLGLVVNYLMISIDDLNSWKKG